VSPARTDGRPYRGPCTGRQCGEWQRAAAFERAAAYFWIFDYLVLDTGSASLEGMAVTADYFSVIGRTPMLGRVFTPQETSARTHPVALISHDLWQRRFGGDPRVVGTTMTLSRHRALTIVGVMPPGIRFLPAPLSEESPGYDVDAPVDFWVPQAVEAFPLDVPIWNAVARLRPGVTLDQARAELSAIAARQAKDHPKLRDLTATVEPIQAVMNRRPARLLVPLLGAAGCVLLIACANAAALQLARALRRDGELAVHAALGAGPGRLVRRAVIEHLALGIGSGAAGGGLAYATLSVLMARIAPAVPRLDTVALDASALGWGVGLGCVAGLVAGLPGALRIARRASARAVEHVGPSPRVAGGGWRSLQLLTGAQIALTIALLVPAGLLLRSLQNATGVAVGYRTDHVLTMMVTHVGDDWQAFHRRALEEVGKLPAVDGVAFAWGLPLTSTSATSAVRVTGTTATGVSVPVRAVTPSFFGLFGMTLSGGRAFRDGDGPAARPVAIVTARMAAELFPGVDPIGRRIDVPGWEGTEREIVGVLADVRARSPLESAGPEVYLPLTQATAFSKHLVVRTPADPLSIAPAVQAALRGVDPTVSIEAVRPFAQVRSEATSEHRLIAGVATAFSALACLLAAAGVYGSLAWSVARRQRELAIRAALGADRRHVLSSVLGDVATPLLAGASIGGGAALLVAQSLRSWLFGVGTHDPATLLASAGVLLLLTLFAIWLPVRSALGVEPSAALRAE
jgi:putative ABC transport system permease protein